MPTQSYGTTIKTPEEAKEIQSTWIPTKAEEERGLRIHQRIDEMLEDRHPHELQWKRAVLNYEGISRTHPTDRRDEQVVAPFAKIFVDSKTAEEVRSSRDYVFTAVEDSGDAWKVGLLQDVKKHADRKRNLKALKYRAYLQKNIYGTAIIRTGYRKTMRWIKERDMDNSDGLNYRWTKRYVPVYDDLFAELVSPFNFAVDPNATTMNDAEDCVHFHIENWSVFQEIYCNDKRFNNTQHVKPGIFHRFGGKPFTRATPGRNQILVAEYFNKIRDEWVIYANGIEIYPGKDQEPALPDDHKELPFISLHNHSSFLQNILPQQYKSPTSGQDATGGVDFEPHESFWGKGDPEVIRDLIDLRTGFGRAMFRNAKLAGEGIVATAGNFKFDERRNWRGGDQVVGGMGKFQFVPMGANNIANFEYVFGDILEQMILALGVDPRSLGENKTKTATEAAIQRETAMRRLQIGIEYNDEVAWVRFGRLDLALFQQYYSIPELKRLTGNEDIKQFDEVQNDPDTGKPLFGKRFRRIQSDRQLKEKRYKRRDGSYKYYLSVSEEGVNSFLSRPEYIRSSEIDVAIDSTSTSDQIKAVHIEQSMKAIELFLQQVQFVGAGLMKMSDIPSPRYANEQLIKGLGWSAEEAMGKDKEPDEAEEAMMQYEPKPINPPVGTSMPTDL